jgi:ABC-2 type transport system permease protein
MPAWLQVITHLVPARYYLVVLRGIVLKGAGLAPYWHEIAWLALFAAVVQTLAVWRLAREAEGRR